MDVKKAYSIIILGSVLATLACTPATETYTQNSETEVSSNAHSRMKTLTIPAPVAQKIEFAASYHGKTISDPYNWLKDSDYPKVNDKAVLDYLEAENAYYQAFLEPHTALVDTLFEEFKGRTKDNDESVPYVSNGYEYQSAYNEGEDYPVYSRRKLDSATQEVLLNVPELAAQFDYFVLANMDISPNNQYLAYSYDTSGDERYNIVIIDLSTGEAFPDEISDTDGSVVFGADSKSLVYGKLDPERWFTKSVNLHTLGNQQSDDVALYTETDDAFFISFYITSSKEYLVINSGQTEVNESYVVPADNLLTPALKVVAREQAFLNEVDHAHGHFYIKANDTHLNSRLAKVADTDPSYENWETVIAGSDSNYLQAFALFDEFMVFAMQENGLERLEISDYQGKSHSVEFPEEVFTFTLGDNPEFTQDFVRVRYSSMITPTTVFDYQIDEKNLVTKKVQDIPSGYDKSQYVTERIMVDVRDKVQVPVTLVYRKDFKKDGSQPMYLYGYGAYGLSVDPRFSSIRLSLLDRGFSYAIAHIRGGDMLGHQWYLDGKLTKRTNTFNDFVDVARSLIEQNYVAKGNISIGGSSAGGELMGAVINQAPELWRSVNLGVPFVDVLNTMLDASLPLTPPEWPEWGNPIEDPVAFDYIQSYSPYDNIEAKEYPPMFVSGGLNDPRVTYWEPAKWTAKMRDMKTDDNLIVMRMNMGAGHFANSGRYGRLKDYAEEYAFTLLAHGIDE